MQPFSFLNFPYWWGFINGGSFVTIGAILAFAVPRLKGAQKLLLLLVAPFGMMVAYFGVGFPHILIHNSTLPTAVRWIGAAVMMAMMVGWMFVLHRLVGRPNSQPAPKWTFWRVFAYGKFIPTRTGRQNLWRKMCEEGGVTPGDGIAVDPEDPARRLSSARPSSSTDPSRTASRQRRSDPRSGGPVPSATGSGPSPSVLPFYLR